MPKKPHQPVTRDTVDDKFTKIPRYFIERGRYLTPPAKWVFVVLKTFENNKTKEIFPSHATIEELSGLSRKAVSAALKELEHFLWIKRDKTERKSTSYQINYQADYNEEELKTTVAPIPMKGEAKEYKTEKQSRRAAKEGDFEQNAKRFAAQKRQQKNR